MMLKIAWGFVIMGLIAGTAQAKPVVTTETNYYLVDGKNARAIRQDMNNKRTGKYDAHTAWWVKWHFYWNTEAGVCKFTQVNTSVDAKFTLPKLMPNSVADDDAKRRWDSYYKALIAHENGHRDFGIKAATDIESALLAMDGRDNCKRLEKDANSLAHSIVDNYAAEEKQYDIDNNHGMNDGAVFP